MDSFPNKVGLSFPYKVGLRRNYLYKYNTLRRNNKFWLRLSVSCIKFGMGILTSEKFSRVLLANFNSFKSVVPCISILYLRLN